MVARIVGSVSGVTTECEVELGVVSLRLRFG